MVLLPTPAGPSMAMMSLRGRVSDMGKGRLILHNDGATTEGHRVTQRKAIPLKVSLGKNQPLIIESRSAFSQPGSSLNERTPMNLATAVLWPQPVDPLHSIALSALVAVIPLVVVLILMGVLRRSGLVASASGLATAGVLAFFVWGMPAKLALWSVAYGFAYALWPILWIVFAALWLYNLCCDTGKIELLR